MTNNATSWPVILDTKGKKYKGKGLSKRPYPYLVYRNPDIYFAAQTVRHGAYMDPLQNPGTLDATCSYTPFLLLVYPVYFPCHRTI